MYVIEVTPLSRSAGLNTLSYYSGIKYDVGSLIDVPVRNKLIRGLVTGAEPVSAAKTAVRAATFTLRKLPEQKDLASLPPILIETAKNLTRTCPSSLGAILYSLLPPEVQSGDAILESNLPCIGSYETPAVSVLQALEEERYRVYRSRIREAFAHRGSVLFVVPTAAHVERALELLSHGIENRIVSLSPHLTPKKRLSAFKELHDLSRAKLIITTPSYSFIDRHDITNTIIEGSRSPHYKQRTRPYLDVREVLINIAKFTGRQILLGDLLPRSEDEHRRREDLYLTENEHPKRIAFSNKFEVLEITGQPESDETFRVLSPKLNKAIVKTLNNKGNVFLYAARRGLAPLIMCADCGHVFRCPDSGAPYSLFRTNKNGEEKRWFLCGTSGKRIKAADICADCGSWRLRERGIGIQNIHDELIATFPNTPIILFDHTTATTHRQAKRLIGEFYDHKGAILLATSKVLPYLDQPITLSAITSLDATRSIPSWRADEELFSLLLTIRERTNGNFIVQTRSTVDDVIEFAKQGLVDQFYTDELELRESLRYPPFSTFIHLTMQGDAESVTELEKNLNENLSDYRPTFYNGPLSTKDKITRFGLIRTGQWPDIELMDRLRTLPPVVRVEIDPPRIV